VPRYFPGMIGAARAALRKPGNDLVESPGGTPGPTRLKRRLNLVLELSTAVISGASASGFRIGLRRVP